MRIERNATAWIKVTPEAKYLLVNSIARHPTYFLAEIFIETDSGWRPLVCAPIDDSKIRAIEAQFEDSASEFSEIPLPEGLPVPLGRVPGDSWIQFGSQRVASWGPPISWWQRLHHKVMDRTRIVDELRNTERTHGLR
ncbi:hypothetical protein CQ018_03060 [Arthrobacter sp. MYb227]|uniref:hypothetical protein n=1 Tax=Arthrobacter sp. MYb227 TaxID=1848601 RepID=UPI000CFB8486|nr:hypothetical protein [Arthrobacter sp. MYb227]PQZ96266.1 hypothetical protein CQ018_03060 [Arthrobacter sp. MYb227]